jgi:hypothetical protein
VPNIEGVEFVRVPSVMNVSSFENAKIEGLWVSCFPTRCSWL